MAGNGAEVAALNGHGVPHGPCSRMTRNAEPCKNQNFKIWHHQTFFYVLYRILGIGTDNLVPGTRKFPPSELIARRIQGLCFLEQLKVFCAK